MALLTSICFCSCFCLALFLYLLYYLRCLLVIFSIFRILCNALGYVHGDIGHFRMFPYAFIITHTQAMEMEMGLRRQLTASKTAGSTETPHPTTTKQPRHRINWLPLPKTIAI